MVFALDNLDELKKQLKTYEFRTNVLRFQVLSCRYKSRLQFLWHKEQDYHLNSCVWSDKNCDVGPDTCYCYSALYSPEKFFDKRMKQSNFEKLNTVPECVYKSFPEDEKEEDDHDFYFSRVLDRENIFKWYEAYNERLNILRFKLTVREMGEQENIDVTYNYFSHEWHLTDCVRCVNPLLKDTCHCVVAMTDPAKYLSETYNIIDVKKLLQAYNNKITPIHYIFDSIPYKL